MRACTLARYAHSNITSLGISLGSTRTNKRSGREGLRGGFKKLSVQFQIRRSDFQKVFPNTKDNVNTNIFGLLAVCVYALR